MRTASLAKLVLTAAVGFGTLFGLAGTAEAAAPPPGPGTMVLAPQAPDTGPDDKVAAPTTSTTTPAAQADLTPDLPLATPDDLGPTVHPDGQAQVPPGEDCVPDSTEPDGWDCEDECEPVPGGPPCDPECPVPTATHAPLPPEDCDDPECPEPGSSVPTHAPEDCDRPECPEPHDPGPTAPQAQIPPGEDCDDPECPEIVVLNASTHPVDEPGREDCDDPECPDEDRPVARITAQGLEEPDRPEDCDRPECPDQERRPETRRLTSDEDCGRRPCEPKPGEDESCRLPRTGTELSTYVAAGLGLTGVGAALKRLGRRRRPAS
jgi:hypothetical protein